MTDKKLIPNATLVPNVILDFIYPQLPEAEGKCLMYICRRTYGFHKERDRISLSQFVDGIKSYEGVWLDCGAGVSRPATVAALKNLAGAGLIKKIDSCEGNFYEININSLVDAKKDNEIIKRCTQLRKLTRAGKLALPHQVKLINPQKKGK